MIRGIRKAGIILASAALAWAVRPLPAQEVARDTAQDTGVLQAIQLPAVAETLRERGLPIEAIEAAIGAARERDVPPGEMSDIFAETARTIQETGPIENFGAFVQTRLDAGLRGRELAEAIRAEHQRRGIGPGNRLESRGQGPPGERGPAAGQEGRGNERGAAAGRGQGGGPPDAAADTARRGGPREGRGQGRGGPDTVPDPDTVPATGQQQDGVGGDA